MPPFLAHLRHTMTYWPRSGDTFGPAQVLSPSSPGGGVRWTAEKVTKFSREDQRKSAATASILVQQELIVGSCVALGNHSGTGPGLIPGVHEILEYRETQNLLDQWVVQRVTARPLLGQLRQSVTVWPMVRRETTRSYVVERASAALYTGPASVDLLPGPGSEETYAFDSAVLQTNGVVTLPYTAGIDASTRYEIDWDGVLGSVVLESQGPIFNNDQSPFWRSLACTIRRPSTTG